MKYYVIKTHCIPTEKTKEIRPEVCEFDVYYGKQGYTLNTENHHNISNNKLDYRLIGSYGYTRMCDANRSLKSHRDMDGWSNGAGYWISNSEIIIVEKN